MSRAASSRSLRGSAQELLHRGCASRALPLHSTPPATHAPRRLLSRLLSHTEMAHVESELARIEADAVARYELTSRAVDYTKTKMADATSAAGDKVFEADLKVGKVSSTVAFTVLGITVVGGVAALHGVRLTGDKASRDRTEALVVTEIQKMRVGMDKALDEVLFPDEQKKMSALAGLEARESAAEATSLQQDAREKSLKARELALSRKQEGQ